MNDALYLAARRIYPHAGDVATVYLYADAAGAPVHAVARFTPKTFRPMHWTGEQWQRGRGAARYPYHLPEVLDAVRRGEPVHLTEGEKSADALRSLGLVATCNDGGAGNWTDAHSAYLSAADVILWADNDKAGREHVQKVGASLHRAGVKQLRAVTFDGKPDKYDVADLVAEGATRADVLALVDAAPAMELVRAADPAPAERNHQPAAVDSSNPDELLEVERLTRLEIAAALQKRGRKAGYYCCPLDHGPQGKDFLFNAEPGTPIGGCQGKHAGQLTRWKDLAEQLQIDVSAIARRVGEARRPAVFAGGKRVSAAAETRPLLSVLPRAAKKAVCVLALVRRGNWQTATIKDLIAAGATAATARAGLELLSEHGIFQEIVHERIDDPAYAQFSQKLNSGRGRPQKAYAVPPIEEQDAALMEWAKRLLFEDIYQDVPADTAPVVGDLLTEEQITRADIARADVYQKHEQARAKAAAAVENTKIDISIPLDLPEEAYRNAQAFGDALYLRDLEASGGQRQLSIDKLARMYSEHPNSIRNRRKRLSLAAVPTYQEFTLATGDLEEDFTANKAKWALERPAGIWITVQGEKPIRMNPQAPEKAQEFIRVQMERGKVCAARVQLASVEKHEFTLSGIERVAIEEQEARNQECAKRRHENQPTTAPPRRPLPFIIRQAAFALPAGVRIADGELSVTDRATGEIARHELTPLTAWLAVVGELPAPVLEAAPAVEEVSFSAVEATPAAVMPPETAQEAARAPEEGRKRGTPAPQHTGPWEAVERAAGHALEVMDRYASDFWKGRHTPPPDLIEAERRRIARQEAAEAERRELARNYRPAEPSPALAYAGR